MTEPTDFREYELAPLNEAPRSDLPAARPGGGGAPPVVPMKPPHECPSCGYNVGGLTHLRCPECGEEFTLQAARAAASGGRGPFDGPDLRVIRAENARLALGAILILAGLALPLVQSKYNHRVLFCMLLFLIPAGGLILPSALALELNRSWIVLIWGLMAAAVGVLACLLI